MNKNSPKQKNENNESGNEIKTGKGFYFNAPQPAKKRGFASLFKSKSDDPQKENDKKDKRRDDRKAKSQAPNRARNRQRDKESAPESAPPAKTETAQAKKPEPQKTEPATAPGGNKNNRRFAKPPAQAAENPKKQPQKARGENGAQRNRQEFFGGKNKNNRKNRKHHKRERFDAPETQPEAETAPPETSEFSEFNLRRPRTAGAPKSFFVPSGESEVVAESFFSEPEQAPAVPEEPAEEQVEIVGVRYKPVGKIYYFDPNGEAFEKDQPVVVETSRGLEIGRIVIPNRKTGVSKIVQPLKQIQRRATDYDLERAAKNKLRIKEALEVANGQVKAHGLQMKIVEAEYTFDGSKLTFSFTAEHRVDFRELVKDLYRLLGVRIEMRQIGVRDQSKALGGISVCGRPFCCNSFLPDFEQVTVKMAKEQNIALSSAKISGSCGRLMCCLRYEHETYEQLSRDIPRQGSIVQAVTGESGVVTESGILTGMCKVKLNPARKNGETVSEIKQFHKKDLKIIGFVNSNSDKESEKQEAKAEG